MINSSQIASVKQISCCFKVNQLFPLVCQCNQAFYFITYSLVKRVEVVVPKGVPCYFFNFFFTLVHLAAPFKVLKSRGHSNMKVTGMCLSENENRGEFSVGFQRKKGSLGVGFEKKRHYWCELLKIWGHWCKFCQI